MAKPSSNHISHSRPKNRSLESRQFKGIRMKKWGKWASEIRNSKDRIWLGSYDTPEKAARAYDFAVYCLRVSKANFNFPYSPPEIPYASSLSKQQIKAATAKFAAEEIRPPSEANTTFSSSCSKAESNISVEQVSAFWDLVLESSIEGQEISVEQDPAFWDLVLEDLDSCDSITFEDFPPIDDFLHIS